MKGLWGWIKFLFSKTFWKHLLFMIIFTLLLAGGLYLYLLSYTRHGDYLEVPDLYGKREKEARRILEAKGLRMVVTDTLEYDPDLPKYAVREQNPRAGTAVKEGRKIYVKINAAKYREVTLPKLRGLTLRQAKSTLNAMGLKVGKVKEKPYFAEVVLDVIHGKDTLRAGDRLPVKSVVTLVVGSGETEFDTDTLRPAADSLALPPDLMVLPEE
ncbi:MAG: PASTA domain-containing protein [Chlorobi bacterium]|nr:PASTA domain-containing protein [Chlorobiota bacterium]